MTIFNHLLHFINQVKHPQNSASQPCCHASLQKQRKITPFPAIKTESAHDCLAIHDSLRLIHPTSPKHSHNREVKHYTERETQKPSSSQSPLFLFLALSHPGHVRTSYASSSRPQYNRTIP